MKELPKFVWLKHTAMRLRGNHYWRDGGEWRVGYKIIDDVLISSTMMRHINNIPLTECTEEEWRIDNGQYAPQLRKK